MRLYHSYLFLVSITITLLLASGCTPVETPTMAMISGTVNVDNQVLQVQVVPGSTVDEALDVLQIELDLLDRVEPPLSSVLMDQGEIIVTRIREEFEIEQVEIPFDQKRLPTELLSEGVEQYDPLQKGEPGLQEITYRIVYENGLEISRTQIKATVIKEPQTQILLYGTRQKHAPMNVPGKLIYLSQGNAIMINGNTANRVPIVNTGDLDGRVFSLSDDGNWLLFSRHGSTEEVINTLWAVALEDSEGEINLKAENVIHFADWVPGSNTKFVYSTVEPRQAAPGWQANNDLLSRVFSVNGWVSPPTTLLDSNSGGVYGWWGRDFAYSLEEGQLSYVGPDEIGIIDVNNETLEPLFSIIPLQTRSDWAWVPGMHWSPDGEVLYMVNHTPPPGAVKPEESPDFDLVAILVGFKKPISLVTDVGMFAYPLPSPIQVSPSGENAYTIAYLQAIFPQQSETSRYRLCIMDRDGSNRKEIFPSPTSPGIEPNQDWGAWSPAPLEVSGNYMIAVLYQGDIWFIDPISEKPWQVTGDGMIDRILWR